MARALLQAKNVKEEEKEKGCEGREEEEKGGAGRAPLWHAYSLRFRC
jgi:hypothetical protein